MYTHLPWHGASSTGLYVRGSSLSLLILNGTRRLLRTPLRTLLPVSKRLALCGHLGHRLFESQYPWSSVRRSQFMVTILKDTVETRNQLLASLVASRIPRLVCTYSRLPPASKNRSLRRSPRLFGTVTLMASLQQFVPSPSVYLPCIKSQVNQGYCFQSLYYCRPHILTAILLPHKLTLPTPSKWKPRR